MSLALVVASDGHARLSPSKAHRWLICPGSLHVTAQDPETEWAAEGTRKHATLKLVLAGETLIAGDIIKTECGDYKVPLQVLEQCHEMKDFIEQFKDTHKDGWVVETETKVEVGSHVWSGIEPGLCAGTADVGAYSYDELLVLDAKFGYVRVEARDNPQLMLYALGLLAEIPFPIKHVTLCIAQPGYDGTVEFREHRLPVEALHEWALNQQPVMDEIRAGSYRLQADDHACRYCPARTQCPARLKALDDFNQAEWMQDRSLAELLPFVPRLRAICKDLEQRAMAEMSAGKEVRGFKLVASKSKRRWQDEDPAPKLIEALRSVVPDPEAVVFERKARSPAQVEKAIRAVKKMPVKDAQALVEPFAFVPTGAPKLVPESDPRPALESAAWTLEDVLKLEAGDDES